MLADGYPAYTTSIGWIGYPDDKVRRLCRDGVAAGWRTSSSRSAATSRPTCRRVRVVREEIGEDRFLMVDANQAWDVDQAIAWVRALAPIRGRGGSRSRPAPTTSSAMRASRGPSPRWDPGRDRRALPEPGRVQAVPAGRGHRLLPARQLPARWRERGPRGPAAGREVRRPGLPARRRRRALRVCPAPRRSSTTSRSAARCEDRVVEYVDHLHEHFVDPAMVRDGRYLRPRRPATASRCGRSPSSASRSRTARHGLGPRRPRRRVSGRLAGKVSLITGAGSGIGHASAALFAQEGSAVAVADIDEAAAARDGRADQRGRGGPARLPRRRHGPGATGGPRSRRPRAVRHGSTCCSTTPVSPGSGTVTRRRSTCGTGSWRSTSVASSSSPAPSCRP